MHPQRRARFFGLLIILLVFIILYLTSGARQTQSSEFYRKTSKAVEKQAAQLARDAEDAAQARTDVKGRLKEAEQAAKQAANIKGAETSPAKADGGNAQKLSPPYGQTILADDETGSAGLKPTGDNGVAPIGNTGQTNVKSGENQETEEEHAVEMEMNSILKKSPIIIFSKTYCPHSRKAKQILLEKYRITPPPFVVELDEHPLGAQLQASLAKSTHRKTVPNILINALSIGGGDDVELLDQKGTLMNTVKSMAGKRVVEARLASNRRRKR